MSALSQRFAALLVLTAAGACAPAGPARLPGAAASTVAVQILAFNDFHGNLDPPVGSNGRLGDIAVGGVEYFATHMARLRADNPNTVVVSAGDNIGATPLLSSVSRDEPTILALGALGLEFSTVGNHEFDEGWPELLRMQRGGCHPVDGCREGLPFGGASFRYLAANVRVNSRNETLFPATALKTFAGVTVGFIGLALRTTPALVSPASVDGLTFLPEAAVADAAAAQLRRDGADVVVALIHEGGFLAPDDNDGTCRSMTGGLASVLQAMSRAIDVVISGHTNRAYICDMDGRLVTGTSSYGRLITDIDLEVDRRSGRVLSKRAVNVPVSRDLPRDPAMTALLDRYRPLAAEIGRRPVGAIAGSFTRAQNGAGQSTVGRAVADAFLAVASDPARGGAQIAVTNWGGLRADLVHTDGAATTPVTYGDAFQALPFGNVIVVQTLTGAQLAALLEQQFQTDVRSSWKVLQVSHNVRYRWSAERPEGSRVDRASIRINEAPLDMNATYRIAMPDFVWAGGDGFTLATVGMSPVVVGPDLEVFLEYLQGHSPLSPASLGRITREP